MTQEPSRYPIPSHPHRVEEVILRSRFITAADHAPDAATAHEIVATIREESPDATHHCWAFVAGPPGSTTSVGMSDDGEPHGTAGRPMLNTLLHGDVGEIVAVCTRYYGGTKLGTGGLSRAYSGGVKLLLESLPTQERVDRISLLVVVDYGSVDPLKRCLGEVEAILEREEYGEQVEYRVAIPQEHHSRLVQVIADITKGSGIVRVL
jgi:uncharacterized YigZ family protein